MDEKLAAIEYRVRCWTVVLFLSMVLYIAVPDGQGLYWLLTSYATALLIFVANRLLIMWDHAIDPLTKPKGIVICDHKTV